MWWSAAPSSALFLLYLKRYLELLAAFERLDADGDRRLDVDEFTEACRIGLLSTWGVNVDDAEEEFQEDGPRWWRQGAV